MVERDGNVHVISVKMIGSVEKESGKEGEEIDMH